MKNTIFFALVSLLIVVGCRLKKLAEIPNSEKAAIHVVIKKNIDFSLEATRNEDIDSYMIGFPEDLAIYDESGEIVTKEKQREYILRDWAIIDTTLHIQMEIDSIQFITKDSVIVFTSQRWERMMFQRDGITKDTVITTQKHREIWKKNKKGWFGHLIEELGGEIYINGEHYIPE